jgi:hypothetical protein
MWLLDRLKRFFRGPRSFESVAAELADGLRDGTVTLTPQATQPVDGPARPAVQLTNGACGPVTPEPSAMASDPDSR